MNYLIPVIFLTSLLCISLTEGYNFTSMGCWRDKGKEGSLRKPRAIDSLEGTSDLLDGKFRKRENATEKCAALAHSLNFTVFAISRGGECLGSANASINWDFWMYGEEENCVDGKGGVKPRSMDVYYIEDYEECPDLETDCEGDCCYANPPMFDQQQCPGYHNPDTWCQEQPDFCMPRTYDNSQYAPSLGAAEVCSQYCPVYCGSGEMTCYGKDFEGCDYMFCMPNENYNQTYGSDYPYTRELSEYGDNGNSSCPMTCPTACSEFDIPCPMGFDENGCSYGDYCTPSLYAIGEWGNEIECPGACYTNCGWTFNEVACPIFSDDGCFVGNTCVPCDEEDIEECCEANSIATRMSESDHMMVRSGLPKGAQNFLNQLRFKM